MASKAFLLNVFWGSGEEPPGALSLIKRLFVLSYTLGRERDVERERLPTGLGLPDPVKVTQPSACPPSGEEEEKILSKLVRGQIFKVCNEVGRAG